MSDRSEEVIDGRDASTEELLEETERLLSGDLPERDAEDVSPDAESDSRWRSSSSEPSPDSNENQAGSASGSRSITSRLSVTRYFSPKAFLGLVGAIGVGLLAGSFLLPFGGRLVGTFAAAFLAGLVTSRRRYLEVSLAGVSVGAVTSVLANPLLAMAGSGTTVVAVGVAAGLLACVGGYYFGRDLRDGLSREL